MSGTPKKASVNPLNELLALLYFKKLKESQKDDKVTHQIADLVFRKEKISSSSSAANIFFKHHSFDNLPEVEKNVIEEKKEKFLSIVRRQDYIKKVFDFLNTLHRSLVRFDGAEIGITGILALLYAVTYLVYYLSFKTVLPSYFQLTDAGWHIVSKVYASLVTIIYGSLLVLGHFSDPFRRLSEAFNKYWEVIHYHFNEYNTYINADGYYCRNVDDSSLLVSRMKDINDVTNLGVEAYGTKIIQMDDRFRKYEEWLSVRNDIISIIYDKNNIAVGFICMLPLNTKTGRFGDRHYKRNIKQFEISRDMITKTKSRLLFVQGIYIKPESAKSISTLITLLAELYKMASRFSEDDRKLIEETIIYAEPSSSQNSRLFKNLGFSSFGKESKAGTKIIEVRFNERKSEKANEFFLRVLNFKEN